MKNYLVQIGVMGTHGIVWMDRNAFKAKKLTNSHFSQQFSKCIGGYLDISRIVGNVIVHHTYREDRNFDCMRIIEIV